MTFAFSIASALPNQSSAASVLRVCAPFNLSCVSSSFFLAFFISSGLRTKPRFFIEVPNFLSTAAAASSELAPAIIILASNSSIAGDTELIAFVILSANRSKALDAVVALAATTLLDAPMFINAPVTAPPMPPTIAPMGPKIAPTAAPAKAPLPAPPIRSLPVLPALTDVASPRTFSPLNFSSLAAEAIIATCSLIPDESPTATALSSCLNDSEKTLSFFTKVASSSAEALTKPPSPLSIATKVFAPKAFKKPPIIGMELFNSCPNALTAAAPASSALPPLIAASLVLEASP